VRFLHDQNGHAKVRDNRIVIRRDWDSEKKRLIGAFGIARDLAALAAPPAKAQRSA
jgi:transcription-repair coupling factor (superfamily II helicase)